MNLTEHLYRQREWSEKTFGPGSRVEGLCKHIEKELNEIRAKPDDVEEWIDVVILALDGAWPTGALPGEITDILSYKQGKNELRNWPDWRTSPKDIPLEHDRSGECL